MLTTYLPITIEEIAKANLGDIQGAIADYTKAIKN